MGVSTTVLNPGSGGDSIVDFAQSGGAKMPLSGLAVSPDGVADMAPVTGVNPLPTYVTSPLAAFAGLYAEPTPYGTLQVSTEPTALFSEQFDGTSLDTTNKWISAGTNSIANGVLTLTTGTVASASAYVQSLPTFSFGGIAFRLYASVHAIDAAVVTNHVQFWGQATLPAAGPTTAVPIQDGAGFLLSSAGVLSACIWAGGASVFNFALTRPADGLNHVYALFQRKDIFVWYLDNEELPVASIKNAFPNVSALPCLTLIVNGSTPPASSPKSATSAVAVTDTTGFSRGISDGAFPWRQATVKAPGVAPTAADGSLVVGLSPNATMPGSVLTNGAQEQPVYDVRTKASLDIIAQKLDAIMWLLMRIAGDAPPNTHPAMNG